jgi:hypothetical protein
MDGLLWEWKAVTGKTKFIESTLRQDFMLLFSEKAGLVS